MQRISEKIKFIRKLFIFDQFLYLKISKNFINDSDFNVLI